MDAERERIQADLRGMIAGEVRCDDVFTHLYASDASLYEIRPLGVVRPRGVDDVVAVVKYAAERGLPIHARGAGTGLAGESLGPGLVIDFSHSMRRILETNGATVRVQPGVVHAQLNRYLAAFGRQFGPDPATSAVTTMGSVLALDNTGSHWLRYGSARSHVIRLQAVLADGTVIEAGQHSPDETVPTDLLAAPAIAARQSVVQRLTDLMQREQRLIETQQPKSAVNRSGYRLQGMWKNGRLDLAKLLVGSEGTLALITEATLATDPLPRHTGVAILFCDRLDSAARAALEAARLGVSACDLMDRRLLSIARETDPRFAQLIPPEAEAMLLVEEQADDAREVRERLQNVVVRLHRKKRLVFDYRLAHEPDEVDLFWRLANQVVPRLYSLKGADRPLPFVEDVAVPPDTLPDFIVRLQKVLKTHQTTATLFAHAGHGQLHIRPFLDVANPDDVRKMQGLAEDLYQQVMEVGGTISGEHGDGLSRSWFVRQQYGPLYEVFREVKRIFDPKNIFNPGKVVAETPQPLTKNLRVVPTTERVAIPNATAPTINSSAMPVAVINAAPASSETPPNSPALAASQVTGPAKQALKLYMIWDGVDVAKATSACNGCGQCRTQSPDSRMCPINRFSQREEASPRAKANLVRGVLTGVLDPASLNNNDLKEVADLCVNCHQCRFECPANVNIPKLMIETKAQHVAANGLSVSDWLLSRVDRVASWASLFRPLSNWMIGSRRMRWLLDKMFGLAQSRKLPRMARRSFLRRAPSMGLTRPSRLTGRKVLYFVDVYANWFDVQLAKAVVKVLEHNGIAVYVHPDQRSSGMPKISVGDIERAKVMAKKNVTLLAEAVRQGYHIIASEPAAALCLTQEYPNLLDDDDTRLVAQNTSDVCAYLLRQHQSGKLELDLRPINAVIGYHLPCHQRAMNVDSPAEQLLRLIPGLTVQRVEKGCSGMAGTFGLKRENFRASVRAGWGLISALRQPMLHAGATECSACKMQMEQGTEKPTLHPIKLLALAYGQMPEIASLLTKRGEELFVT